MNSFPRGKASHQGLLLVGHGTRDPTGQGEFREVAKRVAELAGEFLTEACFLELAEPDIAMAVRRLTDQKIERLLVAPMLLFSAGHAKRDIPEAVEAALRGSRNSEAGSRKAEGELIVEYCATMECHPRIVELSGQRFQEALAGRPPVEEVQTISILVGRGSSEASAIVQMQRLAALRAERTAVARVESCFVAVASPSLEEMLNWAAGTSFRRIVVQPHILFAGQVLDQIAAAVEAAVSSRRKAAGPFDKLRASGGSASKNGLLRRIWDHRRWWPRQWWIWHGAWQRKKCRARRPTKPRFIWLASG